MIKYRTNEHGDYVSKEQLCKICHLKKATALRLIKTGLIPAIDTGIPTARYQIALRDVMIYLHDREVNPQKFGYRQYRTRQSSKKLIYDACKAYEPDKGGKLRDLAAVLFENRPDLLTVKDIEDVLGYSRYCIYRWKEKYGLKSIVVDKKYYFPKKHLLDYIGGAQFHSILYKTEQHIDLLRRAYHEGS